MSRMVRTGAQACLLAVVVRYALKKIQWHIHTRMGILSNYAGKGCPGLYSTTFSDFNTSKHSKMNNLVIEILKKNSKAPNTFKATLPTSKQVNSFFPKEETGCYSNQLNIKYLLVVSTLCKQKQLYFKTPN